MRKKVFLLSLAIVLIVLVVGGVSSVFAETKDELASQSFSVYLTEAESGEVLFSRNENEKHQIASMTKIMSNLIFFEEIASGRLSMNDTVSVSKTASSIGGSSMFLDANAEYKVEDLIKGIIVSSANDACVALAEKVAGSESEFVSKMSEKAKELGMNNTAFINATGLPGEGQYSTAHDVNIMTRKLLTFSDYFKFSKIWLEDYKHPSGRVTALTNTNKLVRFYQGCDAGKTGYTDSAKHCLSASAKRGDMRVVASVIGSPDSKTRFRETSQLFDFAFANFQAKNIIKANEPIDFSAFVEKGKQKELKIGASNNVSVVTRKNTDNVTFECKLNDKIIAPVKVGDKVGEMLIYKDGNEIKRVDLVAFEDIDKMTYGDFVRDIVGKW